MADTPQQTPTYTPDELMEKMLKEYNFNEIPDDIVLCGYLFASCDELQYHFTTKGESLVFHNNIVSLCMGGNQYTTAELIDMLQHKEDGRYKKLFTEKKGEYTIKHLYRTCTSGCEHSECPKSLLLVLLWLAQQNKLEEYLAKRPENVGYFKFKWEIKDGVKYITEELYQMARTIVDNKMIKVMPFITDNKVRMVSMVNCKDMFTQETVNKRVETLGKNWTFQDSQYLLRTMPLELADGVCGQMSCRNEQCPWHVAGYIWYQETLGNHQSIIDDRKYYKEHEEEILKNVNAKYQEKLNKLYKEKVSEKAVAKFDALHNKIENLDALINTVANKYSSNLYCAIEIEEGMDKEPIIKAITDALHTNGHLKGEDGKKISNHRTTMKDLFGIPAKHVDLKNNTLYIIEEIDEFVYSSQANPTNTRQAKKVFAKTLAKPEKGKFIMLIGYPGELQMLFSLDNRMKYLYDNLKIVVKEMSDDELWEMYVANLDSIVQDSVKADEHEFRTQFNEFIQTNRYVIPFKNAELAAFAAQYANARGEFAIPPSVYKKQTLDESLADIVGLESVKNKMKELEKYALFINKAKSTNMKIPEQNMHMVFTGNPGSGKTVMARIMAQMLYDIGFVKHNKLIEVERKDLIAEYLGQTAPKVTEVINKAIGGVLFIDEAYSLTPVKSDKDYGHEAIATLIKAMEDRKGEFVCIFAGYKDEMKQFIDSNPGIKSRIGYTFHFEDYSPAELTEILKRKLKKSGFNITDEALEEAQKVLAIYSKRKNAGNGRLVDKMVQEILVNHSVYMDGTDGKMWEITTDDLPTVGQLANEPAEKGDYKVGFDGIIGMENLKEQVDEFASYVQFQKKAENTGIMLPKTSMHMIFTGNPGTGKTTVARLIARMLFDMDIIHENKLVEVDRKDLVGTYVGQTAPKTMEVIDRAMGGVLFIDEAYALCGGQGSKSDYGAEAVATLIKAMEDNKDNLIVIFAGYKDEMKQFVDINPGIASRIGYTFHFEDYSPEELRDIFVLKMTKTGFVVSEPANEKVLSICKYFHRVENLGNGRFVDKLVQETIMNHAKANKENMALIEEDVVPSIADVTATLSTTSHIMDASKITKESLQKTAVHEIGHAYVRYKLFSDPEIVKITINAEGVGTLGYVEHKSNSGGLTQSKEELMNRITVFLAGMASEELFKGKFENGNTSDLQHATNVAKNMVTRYGMSELGLVYIENADITDKLIYDAVNKILTECLARAKKILSDNKGEVVRLSNVLLTKKELTGEQFMELVSQNKEDKK